MFKIDFTRLVFLSAFVGIFLTVITAAGGVEAETSGVYVGGKYFPDGDWRQSPRFDNPRDDTSRGIPTPGTWPTGLDRVDTDTIFWLADIDSRLIYQLSLETGDSAFSIDSSFTAPSEDTALTSPGGVLWLNSRVWIVNEQEGRLYQVDPEDLSVIYYWLLPDFSSPDPNSFGLAWDGQFLWHSQYGDQARIFQMDTTDMSVRFSFFPPSNFILGIAWRDGFIYGVDKNQRMLYKMNPVGGFVVEAVPWDVPYPLGLDWDGDSWWNVSSRADSGGRGAVFSVSGQSAVESPWSSPAPGTFVTLTAYPNPFNQKTVARFEMRDASQVKLSVYDISGREVASLVDGHLSSGCYEIAFDGTDLVSGVYFASLEAGGVKLVRKMLVVK